METLYGKPGSSETILAVNAMEAHNLQVVGFVKVQKPRPEDGRLYILDETGNWEPVTDTTAIKHHRGDQYLQEWPVTSQIEAITDHLAGDSTKLNELLLFLKKVKDNNPYTD